MSSSASFPENHHRHRHRLLPSPPSSGNVDFSGGMDSSVIEKLLPAWLVGRWRVAEENCCKEKMRTKMKPNPRKIEIRSAGGG